MCQSPELGGLVQPLHATIKTELTGLEARLKNASGGYTPEWRWQTSLLGRRQTVFCFDLRSGHQFSGVSAEVPTYQKVGADHAFPVDTRVCRGYWRK